MNIEKKQSVEMAPDTQRVNNKKNIIPIIIIILLILAGGVLGYFYLNNSNFNTQSMSLEKVLEKEKTDITKSQTINTIGTTEVDWSTPDGENNNLVIDTKYDVLLSMVDKKMSLNLKNKINGKIKDQSQNLDLNLKDLNLDFQISLINNKIYLKLNTDLNKISALMPTEQEKASVLMMGSMFINKDYVFDLTSLPTEIKTEANLEENMFNIEKITEMIDTELQLVKKHQPVELKYTGKTEKINGGNTGKYEVVFDTEKTINFIADLVKAIMESEGVSLTAEEIKYLEDTKKDFIAHKNIIEDNISGKMFIWATTDGSILKEQVTANIDIESMIDDLYEDVQKPINLTSEINIDFTAFIKIDETLQIIEPKNAIDLMTILSGFMPATSLNSMSLENQTLKSPIIK